MNTLPLGLASSAGNLVMASSSERRAVTSVFHSPLRPIGLTAGLFSMLSFVLVTWLPDNHNAELGRIAIIDLVASVALVGSALIDRFAGKRDAAP